MRCGFALALVLASMAIGPPAFAQDVPAQEVPDAPDSGPAAPPEQAGPTVNPPALLESPPPTFPAAALADRVHGIVVVELTISAEGKVKDATVGSLTIIPEEGQPRAGDGRYGFGPAAVEAAMQMVFRPAEYGGQPFEVQINYTYRFGLPPKAEEPEEVKDDTPQKLPAINYQGALLERGSRSVVPGATITVFRGEGDALEGFEATSSAEGTFQFYDLPEGSWNVRIEREGYIPVVTDETLTSTEVVEGRYWIEKGSYNEYDLTIEAERPRKEVNRRSLSSSEIGKIPGTISDDPVLVIENLPGVARSGPVGGQIIVRGSGPEDTGVFVNGVNVPLIYHFGGLKSVLPANVIGGIDFYPGNYSVQYGRAMGGILDLQLKRLEPDIVHGSADISILDTSLYLEVPLGETAAIAFSGRRSYVDYVLEATIPDDAGLALVSAPRYYDYQVLGNYRPKRSHEFRWLAMGSDDLLELLFEDPADTAGPGLAESNEFSAQTAFQRLIADHRYTPSAKLSNFTRLSMGRDSLNLDALGAFRFDLSIQSLSLRDNLTYKLRDDITIETGIDTLFQRSSASIRLPQPPSEGQPDGDGPPDEDEILETEIKGKLFLDAAPFVEAQLRFGQLMLVPGLRLDYFGNADEFSVDPRVSLRYQLGGGFAAKAGAAVVHQSPTFAQLDGVFGNPELALQKAIQYSIGTDWQATDTIRADVTLFYKDLDDLVSTTDSMIVRDGRMVPARYDNRGVGRVYGAEVFIDHDFNGQFNGWLSYTFSRAERRDSGAEEYRLFDFDQTHILALVGSYLLPRNWQVGARYRLVSGSPDTPIIGGVFQSETDTYSPIYGETNSDRLPLFQQFDVRIDKTFVYDTWKLAAYLSLINATNHANVEGITYNFDYTERGSVTGLPILPVFGIKGEW